MVHKKIKILVIGSNSFIGKHFIQYCLECKDDIDCKSCSHKEIPKDINNYDWVVNFSINPRYYSSKYSVNIDQDLSIVNKLETANPRYVMISSRLVYVDKDDTSLLTEQSETNFNQNSLYGINKRITETACIRKYPKDRLLIIRASNIIGLEPGRRTFMGVAQESLLKRGEIILDIKKEVRKDFIPVETFVKYLLEVMLSGFTGIMNMGSGIPISVFKACKLLMKGYGSGVLKFQEKLNNSGQFELNLAKMKSIIKEQMSVDEMNNYIVSLGMKLKELN